MSPFKQKVINVVRLIPSGKVLSYGQIALYIGVPRAARQVGWTLRQLGSQETVPWWRVVNQKGRISIDSNFHADKELQKKLLQADGVEVNEFQVDINKYRFLPSEEWLQKISLEAAYIKKVSDNA